MELLKFFNITKPLSLKTADEIYNEANLKLKTLLKGKNVNVILYNLIHFSLFPHFQSLFLLKGVPCILKKFNITSKMFFFIVATLQPTIAPSNSSSG